MKVPPRPLTQLLAVAQARHLLLQVPEAVCPGPSAGLGIGAPPEPPSMGFSRQEYWSGVPLPSLELNPGYPLNRERGNV